eukprot:scaffold169583_cov36-Tisochrysis_lutea.AAC.1
MVACAEKHDACATALIEAGASLHIHDGEDTALMLACESGSVESVRALVRSGAPLSYGGLSRTTALMTACCFNHEECVRVLVEAGASVDMVNRNPRSERPLPSWRTK